MAPRSEHPTTTASHFPHHRVVIVRAARTSSSQKIRKPRLGALYYGPLTLLGLGLLALIIPSSRTWVLNLAFSPTHSPQPTLPPLEEARVPKIEGGIPLFRDPERATQLALKMGLQESDPKRPGWKYGTIWHSGAQRIIVKGQLTEVGDTDNYVSCFHKGKNSTTVEKVTWSASAQNHRWEGPGPSTTLVLFRDYCRAYVQELGCELPSGLLEQNPISKPEHWETDLAIFDLKRNKGAFDYWWEFTIIAKD